MFRQESDAVVLQSSPEGGEVMDFRLIVRATLPPDKRGTVEAKHAIRKQLHPQLRNVWKSHRSLKNYFTVDRFGKPLVPGGEPAAIEVVANSYDRCGYRFAPLVRKKLQVACSIHFLILRREEPYRVFAGFGDLDNRVKTLMDGLRMPVQCNEIGDPVPAPGEDENPFFVLLEDDALVYDFTVTTDRLLEPAGSDHREALAVIQVVTKSISGEPFSVFDGVR